MAVVVTLLDSGTGSFGAGVNNVVTNSVAANTGPYLLGISGNMVGAHGYTVTGCGLTWSVVLELDNGGGGNIHTTVYRGDGTPTTGAITAVPKVGATANNRGAWGVFNAAGLAVLDNVVSFTNPSGNTTPVGPLTITGTPTADDVTFAFATSGRDLSGALTSWSSGWTGLVDLALNSSGEVVGGWSSTHDQTPTANFTSSFGSAFPGMIGMILHGVPGGLQQGTSQTARGDRRGSRSRG